MIRSDALCYEFAYLVNVMACEPIGVSYLGQKKTMLKDVIWPLVSDRQKHGPSLEKIAIAVF